MNWETWTNLQGTGVDLNQMRALGVSIRSDGIDSQGGLAERLSV